MNNTHRHLTVFLTLLAVSLLAGWRPLLATLTLSWQNDECTYLLLILPVSAALILVEWQFLQTLKAWDFRRGLALLAAALAIACCGSFWSSSISGDMSLSIRMFALVLSWIGIFVLCLGGRAARTIRFPLLFLFGLIPFPKAALDSVIALLQQGSAWSAHALFALFHVPVFQQGVLLTIPGLTVQVAQECSSIRSSSMLVITTMVMAHVLLRSRWRKALVIGLAVPLSIAKNGLRIFTIAMLGTRVNRGYLTGRLHHQGGILFFIIALVAVFAILWILRRDEYLSMRGHLQVLPVGAANEAYTGEIALH